MSTAPAVSIITIFWNAEKFLRESIESVLRQRFDDWELILIDDGSSDGSAEIAKAFSAADPRRIRYKQHEDGKNHGMSASRNLGLAHSRGPLIAFLDADDVWVPEKLAEQTKILAAQPEAAMVFGPTRYWFGWTGNPDDKEQDFIRPCHERTDVLIRPPFLLSMSLLEGQWPSPSMSSVLIRRPTFDRVGAFEDSFRGMGEDMVFMVKVLLECPVFYAGSCWDWYRQHRDSSMAIAQREGRLREGNYDFLKWTRAYFAAHAVRDPYLLEAVDRHIWFMEHPFLGRMRPSYWKVKIGRLLRMGAHRYLSPQARASVRRAQRQLRRPWLWLVRTFRLRWLWRTTPLHGEFGCYYGTPVDRIYIEEFLARHRQDIRGRVLEIGDDTYSRRFGSSQVEHVDVLHAISGNPQATIVADLTDAPHIPDAHFDCIILTQTLQCIYDFRSALATLRRILRPGGVLLVTIPGVSHQISREERPYWGDYWRWTSMAAERSFGEVFPAGSFSIETRGNVLIAMALLQGLVAEELRPQDFEAYDPEYEVSILIRAVQLG